MDLSQVWHSFLVLAAAVFGVHEPSRAVVVLPAASDGTDWWAVGVSAGVSALVTGLVGFVAWRVAAASVKTQEAALASSEKNHAASLEEARAQHSQALSHDRDMRVRDDAREVISTALDALETASATLEGLQYAWRARRQLEHQEFRVGTDDPFGDPYELPATHEARQAEMDEIDASHGRAMARVAAQNSQLGLFFAEGEEPRRSFAYAVTAIGNAEAAWRDTFLDPVTAGFLSGEPFMEFKRMQKETQKKAGAAVQLFGTRAGQYVRGEQLPPPVDEETVLAQATTPPPE